MKRVVILVAMAVLMAAVVWQQRQAELAPWTDTELTMLRSLWIGSLPPFAPDPSNAVADSLEAARLGHRLFFDPRLSGTGTISCSTCHQPERRFTDGLPKGVAIGMSKRNTPSIVGVAYSPWLYWDGRKDSLWSQALSPLEDPNEHGSNRADIARLIDDDADYRAAYISIFGSPPGLASPDAINRTFANVGKAIAAYEGLLLPAPSRFDQYIEAALAGDGTRNAILSEDEIRGLRLFIGDANCTQCHNGPLLTNHEFHNTGVISFPGDVPDKGRAAGVREVLADPFNCLGQYSDATSTDCAEIEFVRTGPELVGAVRTPSLRNLEGTGPFMHKGQISTLSATLAHYNAAPAAMIGHNEAKPLKLSKRELRQLEAFLHTLDAPLATADEWLRPPGPVKQQARLRQN